MTARLAFIKGDPANVDLLALEGAGEPDRVRRNAAHQVRAGAVAASGWPADFLLRRHKRSARSGGDPGMTGVAR